MRKFFLIVFLILGASVALLPKWKEAHWKRQIELHVEHHIGGSCEVETLSLNWFGPQVCRSVKWQDPNKGLFLKADSVTVNANLINTLRYKENPLQIQLDGAELELAEGMTWIKKKPKDLHIAFSSIEATLDKGKINYRHIDLNINKKMRAYTFGTIDLSEQNLSITLGVPQKILAQIFKECRFLPEDFLLEIPVSYDFNSDSFQNHLFLDLLKNYAIVTSLHK